MQALSKLNYSNIGESILEADYDEVPASMWLKLLYELRGQVKIWNEYATDEFVWTSTERGLCMLFASNVADYFNVELVLKQKFNCNTIFINSLFLIYVV